MRRAAVIGMGTMGPGIAATLARNGFDVGTSDVSEEIRGRVEGAVAMANGVLDALGGPSAATRGTVSVHDNIKDAVAGAELVIEAVPERAEIKQSVFAELDAHTPPTAILASNTSGIPITDLQKFVKDPSRVVGMHWSNPPHIIPVIELIAGAHTDPKIITTLKSLIDEMGLVSVILKRDVPGFVENRVLYAIMRESLALIDEGVVDPAELDACVRWGIGFKLSVVGPIELLDVAGLDIYHAVGSYLNKELSNRTDISEVVEEHVKKGELGIKTGGGMYSYKADEIPDLVKRRVQKFISVRRTLEGR
jgi:3-hydroxybutyryl-CoA dehydrogenase/5-formyl-3-hydroxy-2-methylpyridine 4-carboxylate dehydrogenase